MFESIVGIILISHITLWIDDKYDEQDGVVKMGGDVCTSKPETHKDGLKYKIINCK